MRVFVALFLGVLINYSAIRGAQTITNLDSLNRLTQKEAEKGLPVNLKGQILYYDPGWQQFYMVSPEGIALYLNLPNNSIRSGNPGDTVEIVAKSRWSTRRHCAALTNIAVTITGRKPLPEPEKIELPELFSSTWTHKRVQVDGVVVKKEDVEGKLRLEVQLDSKSWAEVIVRDRDAAFEKGLLSSEISFAGLNVSTPSNETSAAEIKFFVSTPQEITIHNHGDTNIFASPIVTIAELNALANQTSWPTAKLQRQHFRARVIQSLGGDWFRAADETGSLLMHTRWRGFSYGSEMDISGFPRLTENAVVALYECTMLSGDVMDPSSETLPALTNTLSIRMLSSVEAQRGYPVKLRGVVTFYDPEWRMCFISDASGSVYLNAQGPALDLKTGNMVEVAGVTDPGAYMPMVSKVKITKTGDGIIPPPKKTSADALMNGREDGQWLQLEGVIREANIYEQHTQLRITGPTGSFLAWIPSIPPSNWFSRLVDCRVVCQGACGTESDKYRRLTGVTFFIPSWESTFFQFVRMSPNDPFVIPTQPIAALQNYSPRDAFEHRTKVSGVVTICAPEGLIFFQDASAGMRVRHKDARPQPGEIIEVIGFATPETSVPQLEQPIIRTIGKTNLPVAIPAKASDLLGGSNEYVRIRLTGKLLDLLPSTNITRLALQDGDTIFNAVVQTEDPSSVRPVLGSIIQVDGVGRVPPYTESRSVLLYVKDPQDVKVLQYPPWWNTQRIAVVLVGIGFVLLLILAWGTSLKRQVASQTSVIQKQLEQEQALEHRYHDLFENAGDIIYTTNIECKCVSLNRPARQVFGCDAMQPSDLDHRQFFAPGSRSLLEQSIARLDETGDAPEIELEVTPKDGQARFIELKARRIMEEGKPTGYQFIGRDITQRRLLESQFLQAQKMETVGRLAAGVAHDYNNLLTVIRGNVDLLLEDNLNDSIKGTLNEVAGAADRASHLTRQLLAFSRRQMLQTRDVELNDIARNLEPMLKRLLGEDVDLLCRDNAKSSGISADPHMMEQIIVNLCVNSRDAMPNGGRLIVATSNTTVDEPYIKRNPEARIGNHVCLEVQDTGSGMDKATLARIFEPFFTTKDVGKGTGLGLATVFGIVKQHDGWIEVESEPGKGTTFKILLPLRKNGKPVEKAETLIPAKGGRETILVVEDEPAVLALTKRTLDRAGYRVITAPSAVHAREIWREFGDQIDLLFTDVVMPGGVTGHQLADELRKKKPGLQVILCSGYSQDWAGREVHSPDGICLLTKPFSSAQLLHTVRDILDHGHRRDHNKAATV